MTFHGLPRQLQLALCGLVVFWPGMAAAQRSDDRAHFDARIGVLQRSLADLSAQIERLKMQDRQLQQQLEKMRANYDQRLARLERAAASPTAPRGRSKP